MKHNNLQHDEYTPNFVKSQQINNNVDCQIKLSKVHKIMETNIKQCRNAKQATKMFEPT